MPTDKRHAEVNRPRVLMLTHRVPCPPDRGDRIRAYHLLRALAGRYDVTLAAIADEPVTPNAMDELGGMTDELLIAPARPMRRRAAAAHALLTGKAITPAAMRDPRLAARLVRLHRDRPFDAVLSYCTGMVGYVRALYEADKTLEHQRTTKQQRASRKQRTPRQQRTPQPPPQDGGSRHRVSNPHLAVGADGGAAAGSAAMAGATATTAHRFRHVLDLVDVDSQKWAGFAGSAKGPMRLVYAAEARRLRAVEAGRVVPFDAVTVISDAEAARYREHVTDAHTPIVVGNGVDLARFKPAESQQTNHPTIIFTGVMSYKPNIDAVVWFARRVMPRIRAAIPDARFAIVGKSPAPAVTALGELPGVEVVGPVADTADHLRAAAIAVAPMRIAPGVQNKVLEAMACGLAVVCSWAAASGIDATPGRDLIVADNEPDTAAHCVRLLKNPRVRAEVGRDARRRVCESYDWPTAVAPMLDLLDPTRPPHAATAHDAPATDHALSEHDA